MALWKATFARKSPTHPHFTFLSICSSSLLEARCKKSSSTDSLLESDSPLRSVVDLASALDGLFVSGKVLVSLDFDHHQGQVTSDDEVDMSQTGDF